MTRTLVAALGCLLIPAFAVPANAQSFQNAPTTTILWGGSQDIAQFGTSGLSAPSSGLILEGTAISQFRNGPKGADGLFACQEPTSTKACLPVRHLWYGDSFNGLCRIDPEVDNPQTTPINGQGTFTVNVLSCLASIGKAGFVPGQLTFDKSTNDIFTVDISRIAAGILRAHYLPAGDNGQGSLDLVHVDSLLGTQNTRNAFGGCPQLQDPHTGNPVPVQPSAAALGPDGNLYTGSLRDGAFIRIIGPATFDTNNDCLTAGNTGQDPTKKEQIPILSFDEKFGAGHTFGIGFVGTTMVSSDNIAPEVLVNATSCLTPANGNKTCGGQLVGGANQPSEILSAQVGAAQDAVISDAQFPSFPGNAAYFASQATLTRVTNLGGDATAVTANLNYGGSFPFIFGITADPLDPNNATIFVGSDPSQGGINGSGQIWKVTPVPPAPGPPAAPVVTNAVAGPGTGQATVNWAATVNGQPIVTFQVEILLASLTGGSPTPSGLPNVTVSNPASSAIISGLTVGTTYQFAVEACNEQGCSAFSNASAFVTAFQVSIPPAPTNVVGVDAGTGTSAALAWTQSGNGNSPVTSSSITALLNGVAVSSTTVIGSGTGGTVTGLTCGNSYTFTVAATNAVGTGPTSQPSLPVSIACVTAADVSVTESVPSSTVNAGSDVTYTITIHNGGPASAPVVQFSETLPAPLLSSTTSQGVCAGTAGLTTFNCNLGSLALGATATVTVTVALPAGTAGTFTNSVTVGVTDSTGTNIDPNLSNNTASASVTAGSSGGGCTATTTDIQVGGASNNGNPVHGTPVTITWQIKDSQGTIAANCSTFTASTTAPSGASYTISSASATQGACSIVSNQLSCNLGNISGGTTATVTVTAIPSAPAPANSYAMSGSASFTGTDTNTANNTSTVLIGAQ